MKNFYDLKDPDKIHELRHNFCDLIRKTMKPIAEKEFKNYNIKIIF